jgi:hypothetical protein
MRLSKWLLMNTVHNPRTTYLFHAGEKR